MLSAEEYYQNQKNSSAVFLETISDYPLLFSAITLTSESGPKWPYMLHKNL